MTAYYNEIDAYAAQWLRNLIAQGLIADGDVDTRSIGDVTPNDVRGYTQCHFFAGIGGWSGALRLSSVWPDRRPVWTGSCPCQPFSLAGKQGGFADERHLWPHFRYLIAQCRPAVVLGEQVASATAWLGLVRGDLEALDYAVGCMPVEAASAGADHLRDRYWFVADDGSGRCAGSNWRQGEQPRRAETVSASDTSGVDQVDAARQGLAFGSIADRQRGIVRQEGPPVAAAGDRSQPLADSDFFGSGQERQQRGGQFGRTSGDQEARDSGELADSEIERRLHRNGGPVQGTAEREWPPQQFERRSGDAGGDISHAERAGVRCERPAAFVGETAEMQRTNEQRERFWADTGAVCAPEFEWVIGADGKQRRVKPGIRLLAHGVPARVAKLRALGNAIDLRPAAEFIKAVDGSLT